MSKEVGSFSEEIINILSLNINIGTKIFIGDSNLKHIKNKHLSDYNKYGEEIDGILANPDYVGMHNTNGSIEFVKEFDMDNEFVKVAVRCSGSNLYYVRSIYILQNSRVISFINKGYLHKVN